jgi:hypothetical protein
VNEESLGGKKEHKTMREIEVEIDSLLAADFDPSPLLGIDTDDLGATPEAFTTSSFAPKFAVGFDDSETGGDEEEIFDVYDHIAGDSRFAVGDGGDIMVGGLFGDIVRSVKNVTKAATRSVAKGLGSVAKAAGKIPVVGTPLHAALGAANAPFRLADKITHGARLDRAVLGNLKEQLASARTLAPYVQTVTSMVPGVGSGVAGAIGAASALAQGRPITEAAMAAVRAAVPGGALAQGGFDLARRLAKGQKVTGALLSSARSQLPKEAQAAFDTGLALAQGKKMQDVLVKGVLKLTPEGMTPLAKAGATLAKIDPKMRGLRNALSGKEKIGFDLVNGMLAHSGVPEHAVLALRQKLGPEAKRGFDAAIAVQSKLAKKGELDRIPSTIKEAGRTRLVPPKLASVSPRRTPPSASARPPSARPPSARPPSAADFMDDIFSADEGEDIMAAGGLFDSFRGKLSLAKRAVAAAKRSGATPEQARMIAHKIIARRGGATGPGRFGSLIKALHRARLAERHGHALNPNQIQLLASFRAMHRRAKTGNPKAARFLGLFRGEVANMIRARAAQPRAHAAGAWEPTFRWPGAPTGDVFVGATNLREC